MQKENGSCPSVKLLVEAQAASRVRAKDATLYSFSEEAQACAENFMGWADLASKPHCDVAAVQAFADEAVAGGIESVILIAQGGSVQAPSTIASCLGEDARVAFHCLDSDSPVRVRQVLNAVDPARTLIILASKSGGTIEPRLLFTAVRAAFEEALGPEEVPLHLVAITDPGSAVEAQAQTEGWRAVFSGLASVGGRYSALSVFGLLPAALMGVDLAALLNHAAQTEELCGTDSADNPAVQLGAFLYDNWADGRDKVSFFSTPRGRTLGLWVEQLVAESTGKHGKGILPQVEIDPLLLAQDTGGRTVVTCAGPVDSLDELHEFEVGSACISPAIPRMDTAVEGIEDLFDQFQIWEYATAMAGYLMQVCPFDQPDVASAKAVVLDILRDGMPAPSYVQPVECNADQGSIEVHQAACFDECTDVPATLQALLASVQPGDYFAINAFVPFVGVVRRAALEDMRRGIGEALGAVACLEIGPRYLHSTGQLQKGGANNGVFLIISADEAEDIPLPAESPSLGYLAKAQAAGDFTILSKRGRRVVHLHLSDNSGVELRALATAVRDALAQVER